MNHSPLATTAPMNDTEISYKEVENGFLITVSGTTGKGAKKEWKAKQYIANSIDKCVRIMKNGGM